MYSFEVNPDYRNSMGSPTRKTTTIPEEDENPSDNSNKVALLAYRLNYGNIFSRQKTDPAITTQSSSANGFFTLRACHLQYIMYHKNGHCKITQGPMTMLCQSLIQFIVPRNECTNKLTVQCHGALHLSLIKHTWIRFMVIWFIIAC